MKHTRKLLCALLAAALLILSVAPAYAVSVDTKAATIYMGSKDGSEWAYSSIEINDLTASSKITDVKTSNKAILRLGSLNTWDSTYSSLGDDDEYSGADYSASIGVYGVKKGKATISFKVDGKSYSKTFTVVDFANPIKTLTLTGISSANLKSKFAKTSYLSEKLKANAKAGYLNVAAASGWKIISAEWTDQGSDYNARYFHSSKGVASMKIPVPAMKKNGNYYIWATFVNTKTKATMSINYHLGK